jgi:hypothetical protein
VEVEQKMSSGRIRRSARRGLAVAVLGWLGVAALSVLTASSASAAPRETVEIMNFTPPVKSVDKGGAITFVNKIPAQNKGGISIPLVGSVSATVFTDVSVTFSGQKKDLQTDQSASWTFNDPATAGSITYTYRIVPQAGLAAAVANQVVNTVAAGLPPAPVNVPYVVETLVPLPTLPGANLPQLPQVNVPVPSLPNLPGAQPGTVVPVTPAGPVGATPPAAAPGGSTVPGFDGPQYQYETGGVGPQLSPANAVAASAFDPSRYYVAATSLDGVNRSNGSSSGAGGVAGTYDGASVPIFGQLGGLDGNALDDQSAQKTAATSTAAQTLPAAALAAVVALAAVTAALVRTHQASRARR